MMQLVGSRVLLILGTAASIATFAACAVPEGVLSAGPPDAGAPATNGAPRPEACGDVPTLLATSCGQAGCHSADAPATGLDLASGDVAGRLSGWRASQGGLLLDPSAPDKSVLYTKLTASPPFGARMPIGAAPLDDATMKCVLAWVAGAAAGGSGTSGGAGSDGGAGGAPSADASVSGDFTPAQLGGAVLWLDAARGVTLSGARVSAWKDGTALHNDAAQGTDGNRPTVSANAIHGLPAITFQESRETFVSIADTDSLRWGSSGFAIAIVAANRKKTAGRGHGGGLATVFAKPQQKGAVEIAFHLNWFTAENSDDGSKIHIGLGEGEPGLESAVDGFNDGKARLYLTRVSPGGGGTDMELRIDGARVGQGHDPATVDVTLAGSPVRVGSTYGQSLEGDVAEVVAVKGALADTDLAKLESYLMTKYALSK